MLCYCVLKQNWMEQCFLNQQLHPVVEKQKLKLVTRGVHLYVCVCVSVRIYLYTYVCELHMYTYDIYVINKLLYSDVNLKREICKSLKDQVLV